GAGGVSHRRGAVAGWNPGVAGVVWALVRASWGKGETPRRTHAVAERARIAPVRSVVRRIEPQLAQERIEASAGNRPAGGVEVPVLQNSVSRIGHRFGPGIV